MKIYVVSSRTDTILVEPAVFTAYQNAYHLMLKEFLKTVKQLTEDNTVFDCLIERDCASISSDVYIEWRIDECNLDEYQDNAI